MFRKKLTQQSAKALLANIRKEMAGPRVAGSVKKKVAKPATDSHTSRLITVRPSRRAWTVGVLWNCGKNVGGETA